MNFIQKLVRKSAVVNAIKSMQKFSLLPMGPTGQYTPRETRCSYNWQPKLLTSIVRRFANTNSS